MINIQQIQETITYDSFEILGIQVNPLGQEQNYGYGLILLKSSTDESKNKQVPISFTKEELDPWGEDDSIINVIVANKLGFNLE